MEPHGMDVVGAGVVVVGVIIEVGGGVVVGAAVVLLEDVGGVHHGLQLA